MTTNTRAEQNESLERINLTTLKQTEVSTYVTNLSVLNFRTVLLMCLGSPSRSEHFDIWEHVSTERKLTDSADAVSFLSKLMSS